MVNVQRVHHDELSSLVHRISGALAYIKGIEPSHPPYANARPHSVTGAGVVITENNQTLDITCYVQAHLDAVPCISECCLVVQSLIVTITQRTTRRNVVVNIIVTDLLA